MRAGGVLPVAVSESADEVRQAAAATAVSAHGLVAGDRAALLRAAGGQDADRDAHQGHAAERQQLQLALSHIHDVTLCLEAAGFRIILRPAERRRRGPRRRSACPIHMLIAHPGARGEDVPSARESAPRIPTLGACARRRRERRTRKRLVFFFAESQTRVPNVILVFFF